MRINRFRLKGILGTALILQAVDMMLILLPGDTLPLAVQGITALLVLLALWALADDVELRSEPRDPMPDSGELFSYGQLRNEAMANLAEQFGRVRDELEQICGIIGDATESLSGSVTGLHNASSNQRVALEALLTQLRARTAETRELGCRETVGHLGEEADGLITRFSEALESVSFSGNTVKKLAERLAVSARDLSDREDSAGLAEELRRIAGMAAAVADEAKTLTAGSQPLILEARDGVQQMSRKSRELDRTITEHTEAISELSEDIQRHVQEGVRSLQYEDMVSQLTVHMSQRVEVLESYIQSLVSQQWNDAEDLRRKPLVLRTDELRAVVHGGAACFEGLQSKKSVRAHDMSEGEVDLF